MYGRVKFAKSAGDLTYTHLFKYELDSVWFWTRLRVRHGFVVFLFAAVEYPTILSTKAPMTNRVRNTKNATSAPLEPYSICF